MPVHPILAEVAALAAADPATCDRAGIADLVAKLHNVRGWLDAVEATVAVCAAEHAADGSGDPAAAVLTGGGRRSGRDGRAAAARGEICAAIPELHDTLASGAMSAGQVDAVARAAAHLDDTGKADLAALGGALVAVAGSSSVETFERHVRDLERRLSRDEGVGRQERMRRQRSVNRWVDRVTGMSHTHLILDPDTDARFAKAFDAAVAAERAKPDSEQRTWEQLQADVLVDLVAGAHRSGYQPAEMSVLIDLQTLISGLHDRSVCETGDGQPIPPETIRRHACDANIIPIVLNGQGVVLDQGRSQRVANADQRRALRAMYRTCGHPGCTVRFDDCQIHHVIEWIRHQGPTNLDNLLPLCTVHHHLVHEGGWQLTLQPDRTITLTRPDGTVSYHGTSIDVTAAAPEPEPVQPVAEQQAEADPIDLAAALAALAKRYPPRPTDPPDAHPSTA